MSTLTDEIEKPISVTEAASFLGISISHVYHLIHKKQITYYKPSGSLKGGRVYFKMVDLRAFAFRYRCAADFEKSETADQVLQKMHS